MPKIKPCKQGKELISLIKKLNLENKSNSHNNYHIVSELEKKGFIRNIQIEGSFKYIFKHKKFSNYIVKVYITNDVYEDDSYYVPKALKKAYLFPIYKTKNIIIQHKATINKLKKAKNELLNKYGDKLYNYDFHTGNIGWFKNKPVIFDFCSSSIFVVLQIGD